MAIPSAKDRQDAVAAYLRLEPSLKTTNGKDAVGAAYPWCAEIVPVNRLSGERKEEMQRTSGPLGLALRESNGKSSKIVQDEEPLFV